MSFRSTMSRARQERLRAAKMPTQAEMEQAARECPTNPTAAAIRAHELASARRQWEARMRRAFTTKR